VVTFRQIDPLYTLDLSAPTAPRVAGELELPGYSAYLHPVGDGLLLGIGQEATADGRAQGTQVSLFDVSDLAHPATGSTRCPGSGCRPLRSTRWCRCTSWRSPRRSGVRRGPPGR
jgi:hypothetical protein